MQNVSIDKTPVSGGSAAPTQQAEIAADQPVGTIDLRPAGWGLGVLVALAIAYTLFHAASLFLPIFLALFFTMLFRPAVDQLRRIGMPDPVGAAFVITLAGGGLVVGLLAVSAPLDAWIDRLPQLLPEIKDKLRDITASVEQAQEVTEEIQDVASITTTEAGAVVAGPGLAERAFGGLTAFTVTVLATVVLLYFLLAKGRKTVARMLVAIKEPERRERWGMVVEQVQSEIAAYLVTVTAINVALGVVVAVVMMALGMPNPIVLGVLTVLANFVPYVGPLVLFGVIGVVSLVTFDTWIEISVPLLAFIGLTALEGQFLTPSILGKRLTLNPIAVFLSMLFWGWLWGIAGAFLAVPILVAIRVMARHIDIMAFLRPLLR